MPFTPAGLCQVPAVCQELGHRHGLRGLRVSEQMESVGRTGTPLWLTLNVQPHCGAPSKQVVVCPLCISAFGSLQASWHSAFHCGFKTHLTATPPAKKPKNLTSEWGA